MRSSNWPIMGILLSLLLASCHGSVNENIIIDDADQNTNTSDAGDGSSLPDTSPPHLDCMDGETGALMEGWCLIDGLCVEEGDANPYAPCQVCHPDKATDSWTGAANDTLCTVDTNDGEASGTCQDGLYVPDEDIPADCECDGESACCDGCDVINVGGDCGDGTLPCTTNTCTETGVCEQTVVDGWCLLGDGTGADPYRCTDTATDPDNCGTCGSACSTGYHCTGGECIRTCDSGLTPCDDQCVDLQDDGENCGTCGNTCEEGQYCSGRECVVMGCVCQAETQCCDGCLAQNENQTCAGSDPALTRLPCVEHACNQLGQCAPRVYTGWCLVGDGQDQAYQCRDTMNDSDNCGTCGNPCNEGAACISGECVTLCDPGLKLCGDTCADLDTEPDHCGVCGRACPDHYTCQGGLCQIGCAEGLSICGSECKNLDTDRANCGQCGNRCDEGYLCSEGECSRSCGGRTVACGDECVTLHNNTDHCGRCDNPCPEGAVCSSGECQLRVTRITMEPSRLELSTGQTGAFELFFTPENAHYGAVSWRSDNPAVATVSEEGVVRAVGEGYCTITVTAGGKSASRLVIVTVQVEHISIAPPSLTLQVGDFADLTATIAPANATDQRITWASEDETVAMVSNTGRVIALEQGETVITATTGDGRLAASCPVTVNAVPVSSVQVTPSTGTILVTKHIQLVATITPANATDKSVIWESSAPEVATVGANGLVKGIYPGTAVITARTVSGDHTDQATITVLQPVTGVTLSPDHLLIPIHHTDNFHVEITPPFASNTKTIWSSHDTTIASVDAHGQITGHQVGTTTITVLTDDGGFHHTATVQIYTPVSGVTPSTGHLVLTPEETHQLTPIIEPFDATFQTVFWESMDPAVARVDATGMVTPVNVGNTTVKVTTQDGGHTALVTVIIRIPLEHLEITPHEITVINEHTEQLTPITVPHNATIDQVTWESLHPHIATVDSNGQVTGAGEGTANIRVTVTTADGVYTADSMVTVDIYMWIQGNTSSEGMDLKSIVTDSENNIYIYGQFDGDLILEDGTTYHSLDPTTAYVSKYNSAGQRLWLNIIEGDSNTTGYGNIEAGSIVVDSTNTITVSGSTRSTLVTVGGQSHHTPADHNCFLIQYNPDGDVNWIKFFSPSSSITSEHMVVDHDDNIYMVGYYKGSNLSFGGEPLPTSQSQHASFIAKLDPDGNYLWAKSFATPNHSNFAESVALDNENNVVIGGNYYDSLVAEGVTYNNPLGGFSALYVVKYDETGNHLFTRIFGTVYEAYMGPIDTDGDNNIYLTGSHNDDIDWGDGNIVPGEAALFITKLNAQGEVMGNIMGGPAFNMSIITGFTVDQTGTMHLTGYFLEEINFGGDTFHNPSGGGAAFFAKLANDGSHLWSRGYSSQYAPYLGWQLAMDNKGWFINGIMFLEEFSHHNTTIQAPLMGTALVKFKP